MRRQCCVFLVLLFLYGLMNTATAQVVGSSGEQESGFYLEQNYPNPFNPQTTIQIRLPEAGEVRLAVYDVLGRQVRVLAQGVLSQGTHHYTFDAADLASGIYFYQLATPTGVNTRQMVLMK